MQAWNSKATQYCLKNVSPHPSIAAFSRLLLCLWLASPALVEAQFIYVTNDGAITITRYTGAGGAVVIPSTINGLPVTRIGSAAFYRCYSVTDVTIPDSVTGIESGAFYYCPGLANVTMGNGVISIEDSAFYACIKLTSLTIPESVTGIGDHAFEFCSGLANVMIGTGVTNIGDGAFYDCSSLTNVTIPNSVTRIGNGSFARCYGLTAITVGTSNPTYSSVDGVLFNLNQTTLIQCPGGKAGSYTIPNSVTNTGGNAFESCSGLTNVTIPNSVISIGDSAFHNCSKLTSVTIPNSVTTFGFGTFAYCFSLTSVAILGRVASIAGGMFAYCSSLTNVTIPNGVTNIGNSAFFDCISLSRVVIPNSVTTVGQDVFALCTGLTGVCFLGNAPECGPNVFQSDNNATVYYLPGTTGWEPWFANRPTALWNPQIQTGDASFGVRTNRFGFNITGTTNIPIVVDACTNLASPAWVPLQSCNLTNGLLYFCDSDWTNYPMRLYRVRWP